MPRRKSIHCLESRPIVSIIKSSLRRTKTISHHVTRHSGEVHQIVPGSEKRVVSEVRLVPSHDTKAGIVVTVKQCKTVSWTDPPPKTTRPPVRSIPRCFGVIVEWLLQDLLSRPDATTSRTRHLRTRTGESLNCQVLRVSSHSRITEHVHSTTIMYLLQGSAQISQRSMTLEIGQSVTLAALEKTTVRNVGDDEVLVLIIAEALNRYNIV